MKSSKVRLPIIIPLLVAATFRAGWTHAQYQQKRVNNEGWSGYLELILGSFRQKGLSSKLDDNKTIESLGADSEMHQQSFPDLNWKLQYGLNRGKTILFAGNPEDVFIGVNPTLEFGVSHQLDNSTIFSVTYLPSWLPIGNEVWEDPFLTESSRKHTKTDTKAFRISARKILGYPISLEFAHGSLDVDVEKAGQSLSLTNLELSQLQRSGQASGGKLSTTFELPNNLFLVPAGHYAKYDAEGEANSFVRKHIELAFLWNVGQVNLFGNISYAASDFEGPNPVFDNTRDDNRYSLRTGLSYLYPFGWENSKILLLVGKAKTHSNIKFYDSEETIIALGYNHQF